MPCTFRLEHPWRETAGCQFDAPEAELVVFDGKPRCVFHLPLQAGEAQSEKACWNDRQVSDFNEDIIARINRGKDQVDLSGIEFPSSFAFKPDDKSASPFLLLFRSVFCGEATFDNSRLGNAFFDGATFVGKAHFVNAVLDAGSFDGANFHSGAAFNGATFGIASFKKAFFGGGAGFGGVTFGQSTGFNEAVFCGNATFAYAEFAALGIYAQFENVTFRGNADFYATAFTGGASFANTRFEGNTAFSGELREGKWRCRDRFPGVMMFRGAYFNKHATFANRKFLHRTDFRETTFEIAPQFQNCVFHQDTTFSDADFRDRQGADYVDAASAYRTLKLAMEKVRARDDEALFYAYEQQSLRLKKDTAFSVKLISWLYEKTADYGQNFVRPLVWMLGTFLVFFLLYLAALTDALITLTDIEEVLGFALQQVFHPFGVLRQWPVISGTAVKAVPLWLAFAAAVHSVLTLAFFALFLLAIRRRFRLS